MGYPTNYNEWVPDYYINNAKEVIAEYQQIALSYKKISLSLISKTLTKKDKGYLKKLKNKKL